jgi:hypothetical protein
MTSLVEGSVEQFFKINIEIKSRYNDEQMMENQIDLEPRKGRKQQHENKNGAKRNKRLKIDKQLGQ